MTNALEVQHGGSRYKDKAIQPGEFAMANQYDCCIFSAIKYVTRHADKNGEEDLRKGEHFVFLRLATKDLGHRKAVAHISPKHYCKANDLGRIETGIILALHAWASEQTPENMMDTDGDADIASAISNMFNALIASAYPH